MQTFNLDEAAKYLKIHPRTLQYRAKQGIIPGGRIGRRWVFLEADLADYIRKSYPVCGEGLVGFHNKEAIRCLSTNVETCTGQTSQRPTDSGYFALLGLRTKD
jgi:excisionase family DNA binding protein